MTTHDGATFEVRDDHLPDRPPLAHAGDYTTARGAVDRLNEEFFNQLDANGEGAAGISLRLRIDQITDSRPPRLRLLSDAGWPPLTC